MERERDENRHKESLGALRQQLAEMQREMATPRGDSDEVKLLREQISELRSRADDDKILRLMEENRRQTDSMISALQAQTREQIGQIQAAIAAKPQGPDATMLLVVETMKTQAMAQTESSRQQTEAQKEIARLQAETQREAARNALGPREMIDLMRSSNVGQEQLASAFGKVNELMMQGVETIIAAQGPAPHPALELLGNAAQGGIDVAQRYVAMKENTGRAAAQAQAATAQAQAQAATAQAQAHTGPGQTIATPALGEGQLTEEEEEVANVEDELFGEALPQVLELRAAVSAGAVNPQQCASVIVGGIDQMATAGLKLPILDLWAQGQLAELVEVVIPDAPTSFQEHTINALFAHRNHLIAQNEAQQPGQQPQ